MVVTVHNILEHPGLSLGLLKRLLFFIISNRKFHWFLEEQWILYNIPDYWNIIFRKNVATWRKRLSTKRVVDMFYLGFKLVWFHEKLESTKKRGHFTQIQLSYFFECFIHRSYEQKALTPTQIYIWLFILCINSIVHWKRKYMHGPIFLSLTIYLFFY